jgi:SAM-dependent methyltransferase
MGRAVETFQLGLDEARAYEQTFVPGFAEPCARLLVDAADLRAGQSVLDVACGTGIVARLAAPRVGSSGRVVGTDLNDAMLTVAGQVRPDLRWEQADAAAQPFADAEFDAVLCSLGLMFFPDRGRALREMARVCRPGGTLGVLVPGPLAGCPGYVPFTEVVTRHAGPEAAGLLGSYFSLGDLTALAGLLADAGLSIQCTATPTLVVSFGTVDDFVAAEVGATPLASLLTDEQYQGILADTRLAMQPWIDENGIAAGPIELNVVTARRPSS